jgi:hypothetical protein
MWGARSTASSVDGLGVVSVLIAPDGAASWLSLRLRVPAYRLALRTHADVGLTRYPLMAAALALELRNLDCCSHWPIITLLIGLLSSNADSQINVSPEPSSRRAMSSRPRTREIPAATAQRVVALGAARQGLARAWFDTVGSSVGRSQPRTGRRRRGPPQSTKTACPARAPFAQPPARTSRSRLSSENRSSDASTV